VNPAIYPIRLRMSMAYVLLGGRAVLVDSGCAREEEAILRGMRRFNLAPESVALILHTHAHTDHAGSTRALQSRLATLSDARGSRLATLSDARGSRLATLSDTRGSRLATLSDARGSRLHVPAAVHSADAAKLRAGDSSPLVPLRFSSRLLSFFLDPRFPAVEPDLLIEDGFSLREYGLPATVVHTPGHTPGSISILFDDGRAIAGDLMMGGSLGGAFHPFHPGYHYFAEDLPELRRSIRKLLDRGAKTIYLGHGGPLEASRVRAHFSAEIAGL